MIRILNELLLNINEPYINENIDCNSWEDIISEINLFIVQEEIQTDTPERNNVLNALFQPKHHCNHM